jgi:GTPase
MAKRYPKVVLVGRMNVGKSTLFNRIASKERSIVFDREGVTRDYLHEVIAWNGKTFDLVDSGGFPLGKCRDEILLNVQQSVQSLIEEADLLLFMCDGKNGLTIDDQRFAKIIHRAKGPSFLLVNKSDSENLFNDNVGEFHSLGFKKIFNISSVHGRGIEELLDAIAETVGDAKEVEKSNAQYDVTIMGKPNVGKSSLMNLLLDEKRTLVSSVAGTTREAISENLQFHKEIVQLTDTAGVRRRCKVEDPLEQTMVKSSLKSVRDADIVILMVDATEGKISDQELKLLFYAWEQKRSIILLFNKVDIMIDYQKDTLDYCIEEYEFFLKHVPMLWISCISKKNIGLIFKEVGKARDRRKQKFDRTEINELISEACIRRPMYHKKQLLRIFEAKPLDNTAIPTFMLYVQYPEWFGDTQLGYIENVLRRRYDLVGCPIKLIAKKAAKV